MQLEIAVTVKTASIVTMPDIMTKYFLNVVSANSCSVK